MSRTTSLIRLIAATTFAFALLLAASSFAFAGPGVVAEPTLGLTALQAKLDASPTGMLTGYLKTVVHGATIETIPVEVKALTGDTPDNSLILFVAKGDKIASYGGIVAGMSGSPIYVTDDGVDKVIGALSYGEMFTLDGTGLATPIEAMLRLTTDYAPRVQMLSTPVVVSGRLIDRVVISADPQALENVSPRSALVARPLGAVFIGGLQPRSRAYLNLAKLIEARGLSVVQAGPGLSAGASDFTTDLVPGAAVGALATRGDVWIGGLGTVTWADGDAVLAFGHPAFFDGATSMYLCNAWITGVWPSSLEPTKLGYPTAVRGTITQDRNAGIMGELGAPPAETPITARTTVVESGREASSATWVSADMLDSGQTGGFVGAAVSASAYKLRDFDSGSTPGSAVTTTTVRVAVGTDDYTVTIKNMVDDSYDIPASIGYDADMAVGTLLSVLEDGVEAPRILSVDVQASVTTHRTAARIVGVSLVKPLHEGDNRVNVSMLAYGLAATQTVETTLTVPEGTPLSGTLLAQGAMGSTDYSMGGGSSIEEILAALGASPEPVGRATVADIVTDLNAEDPNNSFTVTLVPADPFGSADAAADEAGPASVTQTAPWVVRDSASMAITQIAAHVSPSTVSYGGYAMVDGQIDGPSRPVLVSVYGIPAGSRGEKLLARELASKTDDTLYFAAGIGGLRSNTLLRIVVDGGPGYSPAETTVRVKVRARISLASSARRVRFGQDVKLTARVTPRTAHGQVAFQYYDAAHHRWRTIGSRYLHTIGAYAVATVDWIPRWGDRRVRAVYGGDRFNVGATSAKITTSAR
jgi:hypothetical protein